MTRAKTNIINFNTDHLYLCGAVSLVLALIALYIYFVSASVVHVVMRQELEQKVSTLYSEISQLEASYIEAQHSVSADIATMEGYVAADDKIFIRRSPVAAVALSENSE